MAKPRRKAASQPSLFPETEAIAALLSKESEQDLVAIAIPSHDRHNKELADALTGEWASTAMRLMADLYQGATAYKAHSGIFKTDEGEYLYDRPLIIESFANLDAIHDVKNLNLLVGFSKRMGMTLRQVDRTVTDGSEPLSDKPDNSSQNGAWTPASLWAVRGTQPCREHVEVPTEAESHGRVQYRVRSPGI